MGTQARIVSIALGKAIINIEGIKTVRIGIEELLRVIEGHTINIEKNQVEYLLEVDKSN
jgi:hypothetical protein